MSQLKVVNPPALPSPRGYSHAIVASPGNMVFIAGQIGCDAHGIVTSADIVAQFEAALRNVVEAVRACGGDATRIARLNIYVTDVVAYRTRLKGLGESYRKVMGKHYPAMSLLEVKGLFEPSAKVELEATVVL